MTSAVLLQKRPQLHQKKIRRKLAGKNPAMIMDKNRWVLLQTSLWLKVIGALIPKVLF